MAMSSPGPLSNKGPYNKLILTFIEDTPSLVHFFGDEKACDVMHVLCFCNIWLIYGKAAQ